MDEFEDLEVRLRGNRDALITKIADRILSLEALRLWFVGAAALGTLLVAMAKAFSGTVGVVLLVTGAVLAAVGAIFAARFDYRKLELTASAKEAEEIADSAIQKGRQIALARAQLESEAELLDRRRIALRQANDIMREVAEQSAFVEVGALQGATKFMLEGALLPIGTSIGFDQDERWAISIFQIQSRGGEEVLTRIAGIRAERLAEQAVAREWRKNEGLVGVAWHTGRDAIISDYHDVRVAQDYPVPDHMRRQHDADRYRSMAAIPIRVGPEDEIWGVVAASSDKVDRFRRDPSNHRTQAVDTVRSIGRSTGLLAAIFQRPR